MKSLLMSGALLLIAASTASAHSIVFQNNFSQDTVGEFPGTELPLEPEDDTFQRIQQGGQIVVRAAVGDLIDQPVELIQDQSGSLYIAGIIGTEHRTCSSYVVSWRSLIRNTSTFFISTEARDSSGLILASVSWRGSTIVYNAALGRDVDLPFGWTVDASQLYEISIDFVARTTSLSVDGVPVAELQNVSFVQSGQNLRWWAFNFGGVGGQSIAVDDMKIAANGCHGVAIEAPSWGAVKARW